MSYPYSNAQRSHAPQHRSHYRTQQQPYPTHSHSTQRSHSRSTIDGRSQSKERVGDNLGVQDVRKSRSKSTQRSPVRTTTSPKNATIQSSKAAVQASNPIDKVVLRDIYRVDDLYTNTNIAMKSLVSYQLHNTFQNYAQQSNHKLSTADILCSDTLHHQTLIAYSNGTVKLVDHSELKNIVTYQAINVQIYSINFINENNFVIGTYSGELLFYMIDQLHQIQPTTQHKSVQRKLPNGTIQPVSPVNAISYKPHIDKQHLYYALGNGIVAKYDLNTNKAVQHFNEHHNVCTQYCVEQIDYNTICSAGSDGAVRIYDIRTNQCIHTLQSTNKHHTHAISVAVNNTGDYISVSRSDNTITTYHSKSQLPVYTQPTSHQYSTIVYDTYVYIGSHSERLVCSSKYSGVLTHYSSTGDMVSHVDTGRNTITSLCSYDDNADKHMLAATTTEKLLLYQHPYVTPIIVDI